MSKRPKTLTLKQQRIYDEIRSFIGREGFSPTVSELQDRIKAKSLRSVTQYLEMLEKKGLIRRKPNQHRNIELLESSQRLHSFFEVVPVVASAGCDAAAVYGDRQYDEYISVDAALLPDAKDVVAIKAVGNSMEEAGVFNGDYVLTELTENISDNDLVVASIGDMAVIKRIRYGPSAVVLKPESKDPRYHPIILKDSSRILGKVLNVIRMSHQELTYHPI